MPPAPAPGLLRRRYSAPETIMRRYLLAQRRSDSEGGGRSSEPSPVGMSPGPGSAAARDLMRRDALLRRLCAAACECDLSPACAPADPGPPLATTDLGSPSADTSYELLEIVVSETVSEDHRPPRLPLGDARLDLDEYVSCVLTESLRSLSDRLESASASIGGTGVGLDVIEKEIKVRLRNAAVNTVVHLSPTSNHQIIFGNEELGGREGNIDEPYAPSSSSRRLMQNLFEEHQTACGLATASASVEVNATSSEAERAPSPCASLVDSLDEPASPRLSSDIPLISARLVDKGETFFVKLEDGVSDDLESSHVADHMPEKLRNRLHRRHLRREMRAETARRERRGARLDEEVRSLPIDVCSVRTPAEAVRARPRRSPGSSDRASGRDLSSIIHWNDRKAKEISNKSHNGCSTRGPERPSRRVYHKSEIHDSRGRVEILEILELTRSSRGSSETDSDDGPLQMRTRRSRIPVPVSEALAKRATSSSAESRPRSSSLRFDRVFDAIPEERSSLCGDSPARRGSVPAMPGADEEELARRSRLADIESRGGGPGSRSRGAGASPSSSSSASRSRVRPAARPDSRPEGPSSRAGRGRRSVGTQADGRCARAPRVVVRRAAQPCPRPRARARAPVVQARASPSRPRRPQRPPTAAMQAPAQATHRAAECGGGAAAAPAGSWSVTVAGSLGAARPTDLEMRVRFAPPSAARAPHRPPRTPAPHRAARSPTDTSNSDAHESMCGLVACECAKALVAPPPRPPPPAPCTAGCVVALRDHDTDSKGTTRRARGERRRRGSGARRDLSVLGCAIAPERKPRARTMSERDLTRRAPVAPCACPRHA